MALKKKSKSENIKEIWILVNDTSKIRIELTEFKGVNRFDIREYVETEKYTGFTKKGINLPTEFLEEIYNSLGKILETAKSEDLFNPKEEEE